MAPQTKKKEAPRPDLSGYTEYFRKPMKILAKRLDKDKEYTTAVNGTEQIYVGLPGQIDVYFLTPDGNISKNEPYDIETFKKKFTTNEKSGNLFE